MENLLATIIALGIILLPLIVLCRVQKLDIPRVSPKPWWFGNTSQSYFSTHSLQLLEEGYAKVQIRNMDCTNHKTNIALSTNTTFILCITLQLI